MTNSNFRFAFFGFRRIPRSLFPDPGDLSVTDEMLQIEITAHERDVLLRGLRFVRSAVMLESREPSPNDTYQRSGQLDEIQMLSQRLESTDPLGVPA